MDNIDYIAVGIMGGFILMGILWMDVDNTPHLIEQIEELGESICNQEYNQTFEKYKDNTLSCVPNKLDYDGISIKIGGQ